RVCGNGPALPAASGPRRTGNPLEPRPPRPAWESRRHAPASPSRMPRRRSTRESAWDDSRTNNSRTTGTGRTVGEWEENESAGTRTQHQRLKRPLLYQLSYAFGVTDILRAGRVRANRGGSLRQLQPRPEGRVVRVGELAGDGERLVAEVLVADGVVDAEAGVLV